MVQRTTLLKKSVAGLYTILMPMTKMPYVGAAATIVKNGIRLMRNTLFYIEPRIVRIDKRLYPWVRNKINTLKSKAGRVEGKFQTALYKTGVSHNLKSIY